MLFLFVLRQKNKSGLETIQTTTSSIFSKITFKPEPGIVQKTGNGILKVYLRNHTEYEYTIPIKVWESFKNAGSYGSYWNTYIKNNYQYNRNI